MDVVQDCAGIECSSPFARVALLIRPMGWAAISKQKLTLIKPERPSVLTSQPLVQARSLGECPTPTGCIRAPSRLPSSNICLHCSAVVGANTRVGLHLNVRAQFVKLAREELDGIETGSRARCSSKVGTLAKSDISVVVKNCWEKLYSSRTAWPWCCTFWVLSILFRRHERRGMRWSNDEQLDGSASFYIQYAQG